MATISVLLAWLCVAVHVMGGTRGRKESPSKHLQNTTTCWEAWKKGGIYTDCVQLSATYCVYWAVSILDTRTTDERLSVQIQSWV